MNKRKRQSTVIPGTNRFFRSSMAIGTLLLAACSTTKTLVVLLPEESGTSGAVTVGEGTRAVVLDTPLTAATVDARGNIDKASCHTGRSSANFW